MKKIARQAKNFLFIRNTALKICDKEEENRFNKILKNENDDCFTPDLDEYETPYPLDGLMSITHKVDGIEYNTFDSMVGYNDLFPDDIFSKCGSDGLFDLSNEEELKAMISAYGWSAKAIEDLLRTHSSYSGFYTQ